MSILNKLIYFYVRINKKRVFNHNKKYPTRKEQDDFLMKLDTSDNNFRNSFNKYRCMCFYHYSVPTRLIYNIGAFLLLIPFLIYFNRKHLELHEKNRKLLVVRKRDLISIKDILPEELKVNYNIEEFEVNINRIYLDNKANKVLLRAFKLHPFSYYYLFVLMDRLAIQSTITAATPWLRKRNIWRIRLRRSPCGSGRREMS